MNPENILAGTASLFIALGDKTRLRLLNLMRDREICVSSFTGTLGHSQPLISRHLAYLRNSGIVEARRDGKWMHYTISPKLDDNTGRLLFELFKWMEDQDGLRADRESYREAYPLSPESQTLEPVRSVNRAARSPKRRPVQKQQHEVVDAHYGDAPVTNYDEAPAAQDAGISYSSHNELEDFLL